MAKSREQIDADIGPAVSTNVKNISEELVKTGDNMYQLMAALDKQLKERYEDNRKDLVELFSTELRAIAKTGISHKLMSPEQIKTAATGLINNLDAVNEINAANKAERLEANRKVLQDTGFLKKEEPAAPKSESTPKLRRP